MLHTRIHLYVMGLKKVVTTNYSNDGGALILDATLQENLRGHTLSALIDASG